MPIVIERRLREIEAAIAEIEPKVDDFDERLEAAGCTWLKWATCEELIMLDHEIYWPASKEGRELTEAEEMRVMAIACAAEARRLSGEPEDSAKPRPPREPLLTLRGDGRHVWIGGEPRARVDEIERYIRKYGPELYMQIPWT
jgi:hypothetical protein